MVVDNLSDRSHYPAMSAGLEGEKWTETSVAATICDPTYAGFGPFEQLVPDEMWIKAAKRAIKEMGSDRFLRQMLDSLRSAWGDFDDDALDEENEENETMDEMSKLRPMGDRVLVKVMERERVSAGGIHIPDTAQDNRPAARAEVVAVGPGRLLDDGRRLEPQVKTGDIVFVGKYHGSEVQIGEVRHIILHESDLLGVEER
jgi:chaperonin GroES